MLMLMNYALRYLCKAIDAVVRHVRIAHRLAAAKTGRIFIACFPNLIVLPTVSPRRTGDSRRLYTNQPSEAPK